jgi:hypothetical protein
MVSFKRKKKILFPSFSYLLMILCSDFFYQFQIQNLGVTLSQTRNNYILTETEGYVVHKLLGVSDKAGDCSGLVSVHTRP